MSRTGYHVLSPSPWPISVACSLMGLCSSLLIFFGEGPIWIFWGVFSCSFFLIVYSVVNWWGDLILESTYLGEWSSYVVRTYIYGFRLFLLSEIFFFGGLLASFIYYGVGEASIQGVGFWPPRGIKPLHPGKVALLNTGILVGSGITVNWAKTCVELHSQIHPKEKSLVVKWPFFNKEVSKSSFDYQLEGLFYLGITIVLGAWFSFLQYQEYKWSSFTFADGVAGSIFYFLTGFHGTHVIAGLIFLTVCWFRLYYCHFSYNNFWTGMWAAAVYWHLVDGVWIFVYGMVYLWGYAGYH
uniref:Cytochrome c oxidase subunit 3 n=1 Tax=Callista chinensis TaxID=990943 RepID=A0A889QIT9_9BIVA|nr:cytochrome c oxidase subunit III [Callista chinensis]QRE83916.1 cytochrome c oxidase subunit III [Callista chinensis]QWM94248.1 cytochrome c oxidase subunit III [Callista chinensis]